MTFTTTEAEHVVSKDERYWVRVAYRDPSDGWAAMYAGTCGVVSLDAVDNEGNAEFWKSMADAQHACSVHRARMEAGDTAEEAALCVRVSTPRDLEIDLGMAAED